MARVAAVKFALTSCILAAFFGGIPAEARPPAQANLLGAEATIQVAELPSQARTTYERVRRGGPFPFDKDGTVFGNRERLLPVNTRGYWREYTVRTPGSSDRGARRIVCGGPMKAPHACYYTADHYASFRKIVE
ncbi:MAG TPA: ribonuclease [Ramlibacter sp.]|uniref:ribonuclease n=1 Tax=Ramlibacter sp. TaxID=1917967 RepID=UPI002BB94E69|nr:ribonuclease [Ramlibacter sp.]HVZ46965.1 ribonuclease [Ramlibacter sp.]